MTITLSYSPSSSAWRRSPLPYRFSQNQAIHCRAMVPCLDTPSVEVPYTITVPRPLNALMSAMRECDPLSQEASLSTSSPSLYLSSPTSLP